MQSDRTSSGKTSPTTSPAAFRSSSPQQQERELLERYHHDGDRDARRVLIERLMPLVHSIARRYEHRGEPLDDLVQAGSIGLVKAVDRFDPDRGVMLSTFAVPNIAGEIKRYFRDATRTIRVPRELQELKSDVTKATDAMALRLGRFPTIDELADEVGAEPERVMDALQSAHAYRLESLNEPIGEDEELQALVGRLDGGFDRANARMLIEPALNDLDPRDREILDMRFNQDLTQSEIADRVGVSQMHVSRLLRRAVDRIRDGLGEVTAA